MRIKRYRNFESQAYTDSAGEGFWGDSAAGVLPIALDTGRVLVGLRSEYVNEPLTWGTFGGEIDDHKERQDPGLAAQRELAEEIGYDGKIRLVPAYVFRSPGGFTYHNFLGLVDHEFRPNLDDWETKSAKWVSLQGLRGLRDKHFGLEALLKESWDLIQKYAR